MRVLAAYIAAAPRRALPPAVAECAKQHVLDTLTAMISGTTLPPGRHAIRYVKSLGGRAEASVVGTKLRTNIVNAALANGMLAHADETDDSHSRSLTHPGCSIVAAALAVAERERASGTAFLRAVTLGYDVGTRMSMALGAKEFARISHTSHAFGGTFGATAASAALLRFDARRVRHALSYAAQQASGVSSYGRDADHIEKAFDFGGMPARNGVTAVTMVAAGSSAVDDVFSGERNFFTAYDESARMQEPLNRGRLVQGLGKVWEIVNTNIKRWSVGSPIQAPLDSLLELMRAHKITADEVEAMVVRVYTAGAKISDNNPMPNINMQHLCALMLVDGYLTFEAAHDAARMRDRRVLALRRRITLVADAALEKLRPEKHGIVELTLKNGRRLRHHTRAVRGTVQNPMTRAEVGEKCRYLIAPVMGEKKAQALCAAIWKLERVADMRVLRPLLIRE